MQNGQTGPSEGISSVTPQSLAEQQAHPAAGTWPLGPREDTKHLPPHTMSQAGGWRGDSQHWKNCPGQ